MNCACVPGEGTIKEPCYMHDQWATHYHPRWRRLTVLRRLWFDLLERLPRRRQSRLLTVLQERDDARYELVHRTREYEELLGSIWLYIKWQYVTSQLTTYQKELFANAVDASSSRENADDSTWTPVADRWWRE